MKDGGSGAFLFTENSMSESIYYEVKLSYQEIFELMFYLVYLKIKGCFRLKIIWVYGTRHIAAVVEEFYRG